MAATLVAIALYLLLPQRLLIAPRYVLPALEGVLLIPLIAINPRRLTRQTRAFRVLSLTLVAVIAASNLLALGALIHDLVSAEVKDGRELLVASLQIWLTNVIVFGLAYWELDRGGPVSRTQAPREELPLADFRFSQDENDEAVQEISDGSSKTSDWVPTLMDYLYVLSDQLHGLQPHGHHATLLTRQVPDERGERRRSPDVAPRHRARGQHPALKAPSPPLSRATDVRRRCCPSHPSPILTSRSKRTAAAQATGTTPAKLTSARPSPPPTRACVRQSCRASRTKRGGLVLVTSTGAALSVPRCARRARACVGSVLGWLAWVRGGGVIDTSDRSS
ncbi:hypothetical protein ABT215_39445 [Streptomyces sp900105755]|uniref:hypothetical protein n=1 Tax=Streptomyces sp. 900105755 TaxID=3154389 RepID=UPI0033283023